MIARANEHYGVFRQPVCRQRDRCCSILRFRFDDDRSAGGGLRFDMLDMFCTRNHDRAGKHLGIGTAMEGRFEKRSLADKRQEGFRHRLPASRPEPSAASAT